MPPLKNIRQEAFCQEMVKPLTGQDEGQRRIQAYLKAGYKGKTRKNGSFSADAAICQLLKNKKVADRLAELQQRIAIKVETSAVKVLRELDRVGSSDLRQVLYEDGTLRPPSEWPDEAAAAIAGIKVHKLFEGQGKARKHVGYVQEVKLWDKNAANGILARHHKLLRDAPMVGELNLTQVNFYLPENGRDAVSHDRHTNNGANGSAA